jgi:transposase
MHTTEQISFANIHFFIGLDAHLRNWKVTIRLDGLELKTFSMNPSPLELLAYLQQHYPDGVYHIVYKINLTLTTYSKVKSFTIRSLSNGHASQAPAPN